MLNLLFAEAALETIPKPLWSAPSVVQRAKILRKKPKEMLLDRSYHHRAMLRYTDNLKRGRPDIIHFALLVALGAPLNKEGLLQVYVHTIDQRIIYVNSTIRLPRNYTRFVGLIEQLFKEGKIPMKGRPLLKVRDISLETLIHEINPSSVLAFTRKGNMNTIENALKPIIDQPNPLVVIGAFPHGNFSKTTTKLINTFVSVDPEMLDTWSITSRVIYEFEKLLMLSEKRVTTIY